MPSSLTTFHSFTLGYSPHPPVSVYGTDILQLHTQLFLPADSTEVGSPEGSPPHQLSAWLPTPTALDGHGHKTAPASFRCPWWFRHCKTGPECQPAVHRLRLWGLALGAASPCADCHGAGTLGFSVSKVFTWICAYSFRHPHFPTLHHSFPRWLHCRWERSPTPHTKYEDQASAGRLIPTILGANTLDW